MEPLPVSWRLAAAFMIAYLLVPVIIAAFVTGVPDDAFACRVKVSDRLGGTLGGKLEFLLVDTLDGRSPAARFVATLDHGYTKGIVGGPSAGAASDDIPASEIPETPAEAVFALEGTLMNRSTFYGEQYLFFDYPQLYVSQVKTAYFWPSQIDRLERLYLSAFTAFASIYWVWVLPFTEEYSLTSWLLVIARFVLVCAAAAATLVWRKKRHAWTPGAVWATGIYALLAVFLAVPSL
jgi:hypothetical protein